MSTGPADITYQPGPDGGVTMTINTPGFQVELPVTRQGVFGIVANLLASAGVERATFDNPVLRAA